MIRIQQMKEVQSIVPQSTTSATVTGSTVDTLGFSYATGYVRYGAIAANGANLASVEESDDDSSWSAVSGGAFTIGTATDDNKVNIIDIPLGGTRKRYLRMKNVESGGGASLVQASFILSRANQTPNTAAERGATGQWINLG